MGSQCWATAEPGVYCFIPTECARIGILGFLIENLGSVSPPNPGAPSEMPFVWTSVAKTGSEELYTTMGGFMRKKTWQP